MRKCLLILQQFQFYFAQEEVKTEIMDINNSFITKYEYGKKVV